MRRAAGDTRAAPTRAARLPACAPLGAASRKLRPIVVQPVLHGQKGLAWYQ